MSWPAPLLLMAALVVPATVSAGRAPRTAPPEPEPLRRELAERLDLARRQLGLPALERDPRLDAAAQAHADDMTERGYYGFTSPEGLALEDWLDEVGFHAEMAAQKLVHSDLPIANIVAGWVREGERNRGSVFHPEATAAGFGVGRYVDLPIYVVVLARSSDRYLELRTARQRQRLFEELSRRPGLLREQMKERLNGERRVAGLEPLRTHPGLDRAAQRRAEALAAGRPPTGARQEQASDPRSGLDTRLRAEGYVGSQLAETVASGLIGVDEAMAGWLGDERARATLFGLAYQEVGVGLAADRERQEVFWVVVVARP